MNPAGTVALVTGGARRVGRAIALELARAGCDIAVHYNRSAGDAKELAAQLHRLRRRTAILQGDLNEPATWSGLVRECVAQLGRLDILVNNASSFSTDESDTLASFDPGFWERMLRVNLTAVAGLTHFAAPFLTQHGSGKIINLTDSATAHPSPRNLAYIASKGGLEVLTKALAKALAPRVQVNAVAPGIVIFPEDYSPQLREALTAKVPLARPGTPEEVARLVRFLVVEGDYITGTILPIDGGRSIA